MQTNPASPGVRPENPRAAACCPGAIDRLLDPALFRALGDPTRARLVACIAKCGRGCSVSEVSDCCSVDTSVVSRHLSALEKAGVLASEREGRVVRYALRYADLGGALRALAEAVEACAPGGPCEGGGCDCC